MSDSLEDMPEFGKEDHIPLVVPDEPPKRKRCKGTKKDGNPCPMIVGETRDYCPPHDPNITEEQRQEWRKLGGRNSAGLPHTRGPKTPEEMLHIFARRLDIFLSKCSEDSSSGEEILILCQVAKAFSTLWDRTKEGQEGVETKPKSFRMGVGG